MKIEIGESLISSWLKHVKECQIVQGNWTTAREWTLHHEEELQLLMTETHVLYQSKYGYNIYKKTSSLKQFLQQAECDVLGIAVQDDDDTVGRNKYYAVDVAFHENGLQYGSLNETVQKVTAKCIRTAMCIYGYLKSNEAEIIFASPKINKKKVQKLEGCIEDLQALMDRKDFHFKFRVIANEQFKESIIETLLKEENNIADTNELFVRSFQMLQMYGMLPKAGKVRRAKSFAPALYSDGELAEYKVGKLVQEYMRPILESGKISSEEIEKLRNREYCRDTLNISFPLLVKPGEDYNRAKYYAEPAVINGEEYMICSQWYERPENNDKPLVLKWIREHS